MLDVAIALVLVYLLLSTLASALREIVAYFLDHRAQHLETGLKFLLKDEATGLARELYDHPLIREVPEEPGGDTSRRPIHIPSRSFALALMETMARKAGQAAEDAAASGATVAPAASPTPPATPAPTPPSVVISLASVRAGAALIQDESVKRALLATLDTAQGSLDRAQKNLEAWFNSAMQRVSTWYRRESQKIVLGMAILLTVGLNVNTLAIIDQLSKDESLRAQIVQDAAATSAEAQGPGNVRAAYDELQALELPIGWSDGWPGVQKALRPVGDRFRLWEDAVQPILGWLITIFAVSLGAPFWFNLLASTMRLRTGLAAGGGSGEAETAKA